MGDTLFGSLMGKLPSHLYIIAGFLESVLKGHHVYHVASPGVDAHQLVGILKWFVPGHTQSLSVVATKDDTLGQIQDSHWQIDSQCWLESLLTDLHPTHGAWGPIYLWWWKYEQGDCISPTGILLQQWKLWCVNWQSVTELPWLVLSTTLPIAPRRDKLMPNWLGLSFAVLDPPGIFSICIQA